MPDRDPPRDASGRAFGIGDRVTWTIAVGCGACFFCRAELPQKCERLFKYGHAALGDHPLSGGLATACHLARGTHICRVPDELSDEVAALATCATATVAAAVRAAGSLRGATVLIQGAGMLGITACAMAAWQGAETVIASDIDADRVAAAGQFGATHTIDAAADSRDVNSPIAELTSGRGCDVVFEFSGSRRAITDGLASLRIGGTYIWAGAVLPVGAIEIDPEQVVRRMWTIRGVHNYAPRDLAAALEFLTATRDRYPFQNLVGPRFSLDDADAAFQHARSAGAWRVAVLPAGASR